MTVPLGAVGLGLMSVTAAEQLEAWFTITGFGTQLMLVVVLWSGAGVVAMSAVFGPMDVWEESPM